MNQSDLKVLVTPYIVGSTITKIIEHDGFYIVYFVNNEYYETKDELLMLVGAGPLLVNKMTENVFETGSGEIPKYCIESYYKTGNINSNPSNIITIKNLSVSSNKTDSTLLLKKLCNLTTKTSKELIEKALSNIESEIELESEAEAKSITTKLNASGFNSEQLWQ